MGAQGKMLHQMAPRTLAVDTCKAPRLIACQLGCFDQAVWQARMASASRQDDTRNNVTLVALPPDMLQHICSFLEDPDDLARCHMVDTRCACSLSVAHLPTQLV